MIAIRQCVIGVDFDNTIISYDDLFFEAALDKKLISANFEKNKKKIRDHIRKTTSNDLIWQQLQAEIYADRIAFATMMPNAAVFFIFCSSSGIPVYIISHKTEFSNLEIQAVNFREAALAWMEQQGFFDKNKLAVRRDHVFFESTRAQKIKRIQEMHCTHFIDDLEEIFLEPTFPSGINKFLFDPAGNHQNTKDWIAMRGWKEICDYFRNSKATNI